MPATTLFYVEWGKHQYATRISGDMYVVFDPPYPNMSQTLANVFLIWWDGSSEESGHITLHNCTNEFNIICRPKRLELSD